MNLYELLMPYALRLEERALHYYDKKFSSTQNGIALSWLITVSETLDRNGYRLVKVPKPPKKEMPLPDNVIPFKLKKK